MSKGMKKSLLLLPLPIFLIFSLLLPPPTIASLQDEVQHHHPHQLEESFSESLLLRPLPDGRLQSSFHFTIHSNSNSTSHFNLLPRPLVQLVQHSRASEVHLSLNAGRWRYESWGDPVRSFRVEDHGQDGEWTDQELGEDSIASGAELWAILDVEGGEKATSADRRRRNSSSSRTGLAVDDEEGPFTIPSKVYHDWKSLTSSLAGLFCASLDALDQRTTVQPFRAFRRKSLASVPRIDGEGRRRQPERLLHAFLPSESICTENLTPFLKLLPCKGSAGLASLLDPHSLFQAAFHGMAVHVLKKTAPSGAEGGYEVTMSFQAVFSPAVTRDISRRDWSIRSLFGKPLAKSCPLAKESTIRVMRPEEADPGDGGAKATAQEAEETDSKHRHQVEPLPALPPWLETRSKIGSREDASSRIKRDQGEDEDEDEDAADSEWEERNQMIQLEWRQQVERSPDLVYDAKRLSAYNGSLDIQMTWPEELNFEYPKSVRPPPLTASRILTGHGQERGKIHLTLRNNLLTEDQRVIYFEQLPWFVKPYLHTLRVEVRADEFDEEEDGLVRFKDDLTSPVLEKLEYQPSVPRQRPLEIEAEIRLPASSEVHLWMDYDNEFLRYAEHPPDAHRGFDIPPAIVFPLEEPLSRSAKGKTLHPDRPIRARLGLAAGSKGRRKNDHGTQIQKATMKRKASDHDHHVTRGRIKRIYTLPRLVQLATPDFSFCYMAIIFSSTVIALIFGSVLNGMVRRFTDIYI
ncbi:Gpi16 subunit, GPI transamidase component [Violaceomyces palustris]|uniref:Gpi16 subunit, GPI transamidase component n=1 Tax=Violaceomyces palustris TaxID=1673888 RepID=A0ACD0NTA2_9BASI|nr:Gpi16 subunit, GPI transamidase component [Violaceomyces palustris]